MAKNLIRKSNSANQGRSFASVQMFHTHAPLPRGHFVQRLHGMSLSSYRFPEAGYSNEIEVLVETDDRTKCPASWMEFDSSFYSSYKVQTGSAPTEVETEGVTCSGSARSQLAWAHTTEEKTAGLGTLAELDHKVQIGCVPA